MRRSNVPLVCGHCGPSCQAARLWLGEGLPDDPCAPLVRSDVGAGDCDASGPSALARLMIMAFI